MSASSCDQGGDCECLCTAIAAFAEACNEAGVEVYWRSQKLCRKCSGKLILSMYFSVGIIL